MNININGQDANYQVSGTGQPVLLLHGWGVDSTLMNSVYQHLAEKHMAISIDLPGFGASPAPHEVWGVYDYADFIQSFLQRLNIEKPIVIGHSFGGRLTIILASRAITGKIILCDSAGILPKRSGEYYARVYSYKAAKKVMSLPGLNKYADKALALWRKSNPSSDYQAAQGIMRQIFVKVVNEDLQPLLTQIKVPTLLIWGENDDATPLWQGQLMEQLIADSGLVVFEGCGHYAYMEQLTRFLTITDCFLEQEANKQ